MKIAFKDYFSNNTAAYAKYRPHYPAELFSYLSSQCQQHDRVWDCATGSGQAAFLLADDFSEVIATDASSSQLKNARLKKNINYLVASAEKSGLNSNSIDLITVAQALHWFDLNAFTTEVDRVLKPGGKLAVWTYNLLEINPVIDKIIKHFYTSVLGTHWPKERKMVDNNYQTISFPFAEATTPTFQMVAEWNLPQLLAYISTWFAVKQYKNQFDKDPFESIFAELNKAWGDSDKTKRIHWPITLKIWSKLSTE